jgi:TRAP-type C4-dicarboxylate transport system permease small subunit
LGVLRRIDGAIAAAETFVVVLLVAAMVVLGSVQIGLRASHAGGLPWVDEAIRLGMMWVALLGASLATRHRGHITIELMDPWLSARGKAALNVVAGIVAVSFLGFATALALWYIEQERAFPDKSPALGVLYWQVKSILPLSLGVLTFRHALLLGEDVATARGTRP